MPLKVLRCSSTYDDHSLQAMPITGIVFLTVAIVCFAFIFWCAKLDEIVRWVVTQLLQSVALLLWL